MNKDKNNSLEELNTIVTTLFKHKRTILVTIIITMLIAVSSVFLLIKPKYQSTAEIIVNQKLDRDAQISEQQQVQSADLQLVNTYKSILSSQTIASAVKNSIGSYNYKKTNLTVNTDPTSQVISLDVTADSPSLAAKTANETAQIFKKKIKNIMNVNNVSIISRAQSSKQPVSPKKTLTTIASFFLGLILGIFIAMFKEYNVKTIDNEDYIKNELGLTDLGTISDIDIKKIKKSIKH